MDWKSIVGTVAPTLATALGGPLAGTAIKAISNAVLGRDDASEDEVAEAMKKADPETLLKLKKADQQFKVEMRKLGVRVEEIHAGDRHSARQRQTKMRDWSPSILGSLIILGFFGVLAAMMAFEMPATSKDVLQIMLGALGTMSASVVAYFFGSSAGSARKNELFGLSK